MRVTLSVVMEIALMSAFAVTASQTAGISPMKLAVVSTCIIFTILVAYSHHLCLDFMQITYIGEHFSGHTDDCVLHCTGIWRKCAFHDHGDAFTTYVAIQSDRRYTLYFFKIGFFSEELDFLRS